MTLCSNSGFHGAPTERCSCYVEARLHFSQRRLLLCGAVTHEWALRLLRQNGAVRQPGKVSRGCPRARQNDPRSRTPLLRKRYPPLSQISQAAVSSSRFGSIPDARQDVTPRSVTPTSQGEVHLQRLSRSLTYQIVLTRPPPNDLIRAPESLTSRSFRSLDLLHSSPPRLGSPVWSSVAASNSHTENYRNIDGSHAALHQARRRSVENV
jgi:hypothetical protein